MTRYIAFLRGVSPVNAKMADLMSCFQDLGFGDVRTVLSSGNVLFTGTARSETTLARTLETGMADRLPRSFPATVRRVDRLAALLAQEPFSEFDIPAKAKRVVTFLREPHRGKLSFPVESDGVRILAMKGKEVFTVYEPNPRGPVFMSLLEKTFGKSITTRTLDTVRRCVAT
ncbi:MAG: DUF1697 domain-containing protein [Actinomycetota bacterium]